MLAALLATIPPPPFQNLELGPLTLHGYGLVMGIAIILAINVWDRGLRLQHVDTARLTTLAVLSVVGGFIGARLYHVASEPIRYAHHPGQIIEIWNGGLGIYGAVLGGGLVAIGLAPRFGIPRRACADAAAPALLLAQAIGRLGNYLNQELFGKPTTGWWALKVDERFRPVEYLDRTTFHPTFLYESLACLALFGLFSWLLRSWSSRPRGILLALYVTAYSIARILVEPLRIDHANHWLGLRQNVWVAGVLIVGSLLVAAFMVLRQRRADRSPA
jgi:prolipoprotein diacylglyceryl transferase